MRTTALEFAARAKLAVVELGEPPEPGPSQVLIETKYTGITNGTERHAFLVEHGYAGGNFPSRHGYQHVGEIVALGDGVSRYRKGDWVFLGNYIGHRGWNVFDENTLMVKLPDEVDRKYCALFGVAGVALRGVRRMGVSVGDNVWVAGQGPIGHFIAQGARCAGARVNVTDLVQKRLDAAANCGAHVVLDAKDESTVQALKEGGPYDYIYDGCSAEKLFDDIHANGLLKYNGVIGAIAVRSEASFPWSLLHGTEARIEVSCHFGQDDLEALLFLYQQNLIKIEPMVSHLVSIDEATKVYDMLASKSEDLLGVIFDWS